MAFSGECRGSTEFPIVVQRQIGPGFKNYDRTYKQTNLQEAEITNWEPSFAWKLKYLYKSRPTQFKIYKQKRSLELKVKLNYIQKIKLLLFQTKLYFLELDICV